MWKKLKFETSDTEEEEVEEKTESSSEEEEEEAEEKGKNDDDDLAKYLADVPLGELQKARADGSDSSRRWRPVHEKFRRANKNRPVEMSTKVPVPRYREVIHAPKKVARDPRFESLCGNFDHDGFRKRYNFLYEVELPSEKEKLQKLLKKTKDPKMTEELQSHITWIDKQLRSNTRSSKNIDAKILAEHKQKEREAAKHGKRPFYLKKSELRKRRLEQKYSELKASGKLDSYIDKRRKKNASKDHRYMPYRRSSKSEQDG